MSIDRLRELGYAISVLSPRDAEDFANHFGLDTSDAGRWLKHHRERIQAAMSDAGDRYLARHIDL